MNADLKLGGIKDTFHDEAEAAKSADEVDAAYSKAG